MDDGDVYLKMDGFRKPPPPIPRLHENRRHSEVPRSGRQNDFHSVIASLQDSSLTKPARPGNYPKVTLRNDQSRVASNHHADPPPPPRPAKPYYASDQPSHIPYRTHIEDPPPRPNKPSYDDDFSRVDHSVHARPPFPSHGPPVDDRPPHVAPPPRPYSNNHPPPVLPRHDEEDSELYLMIDNNVGVEPSEFDESPPPIPYNQGKDNYNGGHMQPTQFQLPPLQTPGRSGFPASPKKPIGDPGHFDHFNQSDSKLKKASLEPRSVSPGPTGFHNRSPHPSPIGPPSRNNSGKGSGNNFGPEFPQRHGSKGNYGSEIPQRHSSSNSSQGSLGSEIPHRSGSTHSQGNFGPEMPQRTGSNHSQTSTSSSDNLDEERTGHDYQPRRKFQEIKKSFGDTPFRPAPPIPSSGKGLPPMTAAAGEKPLPKMKLPSPTSQPISPRHQSSPETTSPLKTASRNVDEQSWYKNVTRHAAVQEIEQTLQEGCFIVRPGKGTNKPYSLTVCSDETMYNLHIRRRDDGNYALGLPKENERSFPNAVDLIEYYMETPLILAGNKGSVVLTGPP